MSDKKNLRKFYKNKRVLVTGGAGFIGSHLVDRLIHLGAKVTVVDNFSTGKIKSLSQLLHKTRLIVGDISSEKTCKLATIDQEIVFHTAAITSVAKSEKEPELCERVNVTATEQLLKNCNGISCFVFSSSGAVYGKAGELSTEYSEIAPISEYGQSKVKGEELCKKYGKELGFRAVILRYFNVYGQKHENGFSSSVVCRFIESLISGTKLTIFGDGKQTRDFVHVNKVVEANILTAAFGKEPIDIFNVASGKSISLMELLDRLEEGLGHKRTGIDFQDVRPGDIDQSRGDCGKYAGFVESIKDYVDQNVFTEPDFDLHSDSA